jgi:hypothetical protein
VAYEIARGMSSQKPHPKTGKVSLLNNNLHNLEEEE